MMGDDKYEELTGEEHFNCLYKEYRNRIFGYVLTIIHSSYEAEEITQEIFIKLWSFREKIDQIENIDRYIFSMARNKTLNYIRKAAYDAYILNQLQSAMKAACNNVEDRLEEKDCEETLEEAIALLSPQRRLVFRLSKQQGYKLEEIASELNLSRNTVKNHLAFALRYIKTYLTKHGITLLLLLWAFFEKSNSY